VAIADPPPEPGTVLLVDDEVGVPTGLTLLLDGFLPDSRSRSAVVTLAPLMPDQSSRAPAAVAATAVPETPLTPAPGSVRP
jgi:hypothetical protein